MKFWYRILALAAGCLLLLDASVAFALSLSITDANPTYTADDGTRKVTAYFPVHIDGSNANRLTAYFEAGFDDWNATNAEGEKWTLIDGGALSADAMLEIAIYDAYVDGSGKGGVEIEIHYTAGAGDPPAITSPYADGMAVWAQAIYTDAKLGGSLPGNPYLDNPIASPDFLPPLYPYQYVGSDFYDKPGRKIPPPSDISWYAEAYLTEADFTNRELTVYDGVAWGFGIEVIPEPGTGLLVLLGLLVLARRPARPSA